MSELVPAFVAACAELTTVGKSSTADAGSYSYKYADLASIVEHTRPILAAHGLALVQLPMPRGEGLAVENLLLHTSGETMNLGTFPFPQGRDAQATGSMVTYHRRYALLSALGMATGEDDDGATAEPAQSHTGGYRTSLRDAVKKLTDPERARLHLWLGEMGLPDNAAAMDEAQCDRVLDWLLHGMPGAADYGDDPRQGLPVK